MQAISPRNGDRCATVPFILATRMQIDFRITLHDRHCLSPGGAHGNELCPQRFCDGHGFGCGSCSADQHPQLVGCGAQRGGLVCAQDKAGTGQGNRTDGCDTIDGEPHMHGPVGAGLSIFARAVDRIDDPDARLGEPGVIVLFLFGEEAVVRPLFADGVAQELVGRRVTCGPQSLQAEHIGRPHFDQKSPSDFGQMGGQFRIRHRHPYSPYFSGKSC